MPTSATTRPQLPRELAGPDAGHAAEGVEQALPRGEAERQELQHGRQLRLDARDPALRTSFERGVARDQLGDSRDDGHGDQLRLRQPARHDGGASGQGGDHDARGGPEDEADELARPVPLDVVGRTGLAEQPLDPLGAAEHASEATPQGDHRRGAERAEHGQRVDGGEGEVPTRALGDVEDVRGDAVEQAGPTEPGNRAHHRPEPHARDESEDGAPGLDPRHANHLRSSGSRPSASISR
ncbi:hypothetical protein ACR8AL_04140 [Clavibacter sepedonicus]|uniref:hypothetical protein n=1 Tax=Clavibacter TaxID=1573 RepID=UPI001CC25931|nr:MULTISPECIES: hypothetical protein [Clavibacter]UUK64538.1 hypothetical protein LRE50_09530 [Clavibacter sepedonicus]